MSARIIDIIDAIVSTINGTTWSQTITAVREYAPKWKPSDLSSVVVVVAPVSRDRAFQARGRDRVDYDIDIGFFKHITGDTASRDAEVDGLVELVDEIETYWMERNITVGTGKLTTIASDTDPVYDAELLRDSGVFGSVLSLSLTEVMA